MNTLAIDIGGTKFTMALFEGQQMTRRESRETDRAGGRSWMMEKIGEIASDWKREVSIDRCGIGFGGPVDFRASAPRFPRTWKGGRTSPWFSM